MKGHNSNYNPYVKIPSMEKVLKKSLTLFLPIKEELASGAERFPAFWGCFGEDESSVWWGNAGPQVLSEVCLHALACPSH